MLYIDGNLFDSKADVLCHQVNLYGSMGAGIAAEIRNRFPKVNERYEDFCSKFDPYEYGDKILGKSLILQADGREQFIANCFCQNMDSKDGCLTNYEKMEECFQNVLKWMKNNNENVVALPYKFGCGIAGGDWNIVESIIKNVFDFPGITVEIWKL